MPVTAVHRDLATRTITIECEFEASITRLWDVWADLRQLEQWWGPPGYPAHFIAHELRPGGRAHYYMTGPEGEQYHGYWIVDEVVPPHRFVFHGGFAHADGSPNEDVPPTTARVTIQPIEADQTRMSIEWEFPSVEAMAQIERMGVVDGQTKAAAQLDEVLAASATRPGA